MLTMHEQFPDKQNYLWYACYGSNLREERFLLYIAGGSMTIDGHTITERGCRDTTAPLASETGRIPYRLFFAGQFEKWENKSAAFLDTSHKDHNRQTICRMYKITQRQFEDVVCQENGGTPSVEMDLSVLKQKGYQDLYPDLPYGRLVYIEDREGMPVLTFTCPEQWLETVGKGGIPSEPYQEVICAGLQECGYSAEDAVRYLETRQLNACDMAVMPTDVRHRCQAGVDYVVAMNSKTRQAHGIDAYVVVKYLVENETRQGELEWRTLTAYGKTIIDDDLPDNTVALDQTLRNAIGLPYRETKGQSVRLAVLHRTLAQRIGERLRPGQRLVMRVNMASPLDMEKNNCRVSADALSVMRAREGEHLWIERCVPENSEKESSESTKPDQEDEREIREWQSCTRYGLRSLYIRAYCTNEKTEETILAAREKTEEDGHSFHGLYPDAEAILKLENDLDTIRLDKYYRDLLEASPLDTVKVKRRLADRLASEAIDFGLVFVLTVFAAIMALNQDNVGILPISLLVSAAAAIVLTWIKTK